MKTFLAIDFGTTQTSVALLKETSKQAPDVIEIHDGQKTVKAIATAVQLDDNKNITYFGAKALAKAEDAPEKTFQNFKIFVGKQGRNYQLKTEQNECSPDELALLFLSRLREMIEEHYFNRSKLSRIPELTCIIGCPSDFNEIQKRTLRDIAEKAGFINTKLCDEPIGVIYFNHFFGSLNFSQSQNILVYDFGGGTTDVAIARIKVSTNGKIEPEILSVSGLPDLGGRNFDEAIADYYMKENSYNLRNLSVKDRLHDQWVINLAARHAKEDLSSKSSTEKNINRLKVISGQRPNKFLLSRERFNQICSGLIGKFAEPIYDALTSAGLSSEDINIVILAGGSSALPYVQENMRKIFPSDKTKIIVSSATEIIAQGLAVWGKVEALEIKVDVSASSASDKFNSSKLSDYFREKRQKSDYNSTGTKIASVISEKEEPQKSKKWLWVAVIGAIIAGGVFVTARNSSIPEDQKKLEAELNRVRAEKEKAERARIEAEKRASTRRYLGKSAIQSILKSYDLDHTFWAPKQEWMDVDEEILGSDAGIFSRSSIIFTNKKVGWNTIDGKGNLLCTYDQLRNGVTDEQVRDALKHLPNSNNVINAVLEIKNY